MYSIEIFHSTDEYHFRQMQVFLKRQDIDILFVSTAAASPSTADNFRNTKVEHYVTFVYRVKK